MKYLLLFDYNSGYTNAPECYVIYIYIYIYIYTVYFPDGVIGIFHRHNPSGRTMGPGVDSSYNRNEYQVYSLGVKPASA